MEPPGSVRSPSAAHRGAMAQFGEDVAARFLRRRGASVVGRNVRIGRDEIDLVVVMAGEVIAVEVKTRGPGSEPLDGFTHDKARRVRRAAGRLDPPARRVDLVAVGIHAAGVRVRWVPRAG